MAELSIVRELEREGTMTVFRKAGAGQVQGRELTSAAPTVVEALAFKVRDSDNREMWHVDRRPFDRALLSYLGTWTLVENGIALTVQFTDWPGFFEARLYTGGP